jgi:hypothetical protein
VTTEPAQKKSRLRILLWPVGFILLLAFLALKATPDTKASASPNAAQVRLAHESFTRIRQNLKAGQTQRVSINEAELDAGFKLAARTRGIDRSKAHISKNGITLQFSMPWRFGLWINAKVHIHASASGFPEVSAQLGDLPIPAFLCKLAIKLYWNSRGSNMPLLNKLIQELALKEDSATAQVALPRNKSLLGTLGKAQQNPVDAKAVKHIYCALSAQQKRKAADDLPMHVRRAFSISMGGERAEINRAAFVALAMLIADRRIGEVTGGLNLDSTESCRIEQPDIQLLARYDLAKHWAVSAALAAAYGSDISGAVGTWKEIADSGRGGSGFSFVDLAADRSGVLQAKRAIAPESAESTRRKLSQITEEDLLPLQALALSEGMSEAEFQARYVDVETQSYRDSVARIDRLLAQQ